MPLLCFFVPFAVEHICNRTGIVIGLTLLVYPIGINSGIREGETSSASGQEALADYSACVFADEERAEDIYAVPLIRSL